MSTTAKDKKSILNESPQKSLLDRLKKHVRQYSNDGSYLSYCRKDSKFHRGLLFDSIREQHAQAVEHPDRDYDYMSPEEQRVVDLRVTQCMNRYYTAGHDWTL